MKKEFRKILDDIKNTPNIISLELSRFRDNSDGDDVLDVDIEYDEVLDEFREILHTINDNSCDKLDDICNENKITISVESSKGSLTFTDRGEYIPYAVYTPPSSMEIVHAYDLIDEIIKYRGLPAISQILTALEKYNNSDGNISRGDASTANMTPISYNNGVKKVTHKISTNAAYELLNLPYRIMCRVRVTFVDHDDDDDNCQLTVSEKYSVVKSDMFGKCSHELTPAMLDEMIETLANSENIFWDFHSQLKKVRKCISIRFGVKIGESARSVNSFLRRAGSKYRFDDRPSDDNDEPMSIGSRFILVKEEK